MPRFDLFGTHAAHRSSSRISPYSAVGVASVILDRLQYAGAAQSLERFGVGRRLSELDGKQRDTEGASHGRGNARRSRRLDPTQTSCFGSSSSMERFYNYMYNYKASWLRSSVT
jgi:hypothetical protein